MTKYFTLLLIFSTQLFAQPTPLEKNKYQKLTTYDELTEFIDHLDATSDMLKVEVIGKSVEGRNLYGMFFSNTRFGKDNSKIKVLIFAQQHGNEQSGKEGALLLARELLKPQNEYLFIKIDLLLIPQMNPDGSEKNVRQNANGKDLNRNHLILTEPETIALHKLFDKYLFEASMDVHEYYPYTESWFNFGCIKNFDIQIGTTTNPNVSEEIRMFSKNQYLPFISEYLGKRRYSFHNYFLGGPPGVELFRHSTYDINDGRQSFGILNTFSFIMEGKNGRDSLEFIGRRADGQAVGMLGFLEFIYENKDTIKSLVKSEREKLFSETKGEEVAIQMEHINTGVKLNLSLLSLYSNSDTIIIASDYHPIVQSLYNVDKPIGYLIPVSLNEILDWASRHNIRLMLFKGSSEVRIEKYAIKEIDSINFEGYKAPDPVVEIIEVTQEIKEGEYYFIPTDNLKGNLIVTALEPKSMLGLHTYKEFEQLLKKNSDFPILRVVPNY